LHGGEKFGRGGTIKFYRTGCDAAASEAREEWGGVQAVSGRDRWPVAPLMMGQRMTRVEQGDGG
jgi:hypothetical protein